MAFWLLLPTATMAQDGCAAPTGDPSLQLGSPPTVAIADGRSVSLNFEATGPEIQYRYIEYLASVQQHLLRMTYWNGEGWNYLLIDHCSGSQVIVQGVPVISPDRERLAVASSDIDASYVPTVLQVWRRTNAGYVLEWEHLPLLDQPYWGPVNLEWTSSSSLRFDAEAGLGNPPLGGGTAEYVGSGWQLTSRPMPQRGPA